MIVLLFGAGVLAGFATGLLIGRAWNNVHYADGYHDGAIHGFAQGVERGRAEATTRKEN